MKQNMCMCACTYVQVIGKGGFFEAKLSLKVGIKLLSSQRRPDLKERNEKNKAQSSHDSVPILDSIYPTGSQYPC